MELGPGDADALEARLRSNPDGFAARLKLIAYCSRTDQRQEPESLAKKKELVFWLAEHHPESEILASPHAAFSPDDLSSADRERAIRLWDSATASRPSEARILWNAATFYNSFDRRQYVSHLEQAVALTPDNENYARPLGLLYAGAILTMDQQSMFRDPASDPAFADHATQVLETTTNPFILEPAVKLLRSEYNASLMRGKENVALGERSSAYFARAQQLDPDIDESWVFQRLDPKMIGMLLPGAQAQTDHMARFEAAAKQIRSLSPDAFPILPPSVRSFLRDRGCLIPQPSSGSASDGSVRNAIQGEFFEKGKVSWAVLCSRNGSSTILVFRDASDTRPEELATGQGLLAKRRRGHDHLLQADPSG